MEIIKKTKFNKIRIIIGIISLIILLTAGLFLWYVSDYYRAEDIALEVLRQDDNITVQGDITVLSADDYTDTAIIFYPGAKVEANAYLPLLDEIRDTGVTCILVQMPFNLAIFDYNAAEDIIEEFPEVERWYIAGHSMGGAMASKFASDNPERVDGLILMGAYIYGDYPLEKTLTIYGTLDGLVAEDIDYTINTVPIEGGNHAQLGYYGFQEGDLQAAISTREQIDQTVEAVESFIYK